MSSLDRAVAAHASRHDGLVDAATARAIGFSDDQIRNRVATGRWLRMAPRIYLLAGVPVADRTRLRVGVTTTGGVASFTSAVWLHGVRDRPPARHHVSVDRPRVPRFAGVRLHRSGDLTADQVTQIDGIPVTTIDRSLVDVAAVVGRRQVEESVRRALARRIVTVEELWTTCDGLARRGRTGPPKLRVVLEGIGPRPECVESPLEADVVALLVSNGVEPPVVQHEVIVDGERFRLDLAYPDRFVAIECDGFAVHDRRQAFESDRRRQNLLSVAGWRVLRVTAEHVRHQPAEVVRVVRRMLR